MDILIGVIIWTVMTFLFSLRDKTAWEVRAIFAYMMACCVILNYFINTR